MIPDKRKIKKGEGFQNIFFYIFLSLIFFGVIGFLIVSNYKISQKRQEMLNKIDELKKEAQMLQEKNDKLKAGISQTESDAYWEEKMREQGYKKPGEEAVVVLPPEGQTATTTVKEGSFWQKIWQKIGL